MQRNIYINKYLPVAVLYFFFNSLFLPLGLLYTALLAPVFLLWVCLKKKPTGLWIYLSVTLLYACIHFYNGVDPVFYLKSYVLLLATYIFCVAFYVFVSTADSFRGLFKSLLLINAVFTGMALVFLAIPGARELVWYNNSITSGAGKVERLKLFTYEASYYSTLLAPLALYYYLKILILKPAQKWLLFFMVTIPLLLSFSFGVILGVLLAVVCVYLSDLTLLMENRKMIRNLLVTGIVGMLGAIILYKISPDNILFIRLSNIFGGQDTSFRGRTTDSFYIAWQIATKKSIFFGVGPGQVKVLGVDVLRHFYRSNTYTLDNTSIPNVLAETLAVYGLTGLFLRLGVEIFLFFRTRVYSNYYSLGLFLFIFIYQFTGSYFTNIAEYVVWILVFKPDLFKEFNKARWVAAPSGGGLPGGGPSGGELPGGGPSGGGLRR